MNAVTTEWAVVLNDEEQYSVWPSFRPVPAGWRTTGFTGARQDCLDHIASVWTDLRPRSVREGRAGREDREGREDHVPTVVQGE